MEEVLRYKVEIDDSDVGQKLEEIRNRINSELSSFNFNPVGTDLTGQPIANPIFTLPPVDLNTVNNIPTNGLGNLNLGGYPIVEASSLYQDQIPDQNGTFSNPIKQASLIAQSVGQNIKTSTNRALSDMGSFANNVVTGLKNIMPDTQPGSIFGSLESALGFGYDQRMPISPSQYSNYAVQQLGNTAQNTGEAIGSFGTDIALTGLTIASAFIPVVGPAISATLGTIGLGKTALDMTVVDDASALRQTMGGIQVLGRSQLGFFTERDAQDTAFMMRDFTRTEKAYLQDINMSDLESVISTYAAGGGFFNVNNTEGFKQKINEVMNSFREVMHILGTTQEDAAAIMAEFERRRLVSTDNFSNFASEMKAKSTYTGIGVNELMEQGLNIANQFRGTGYGEANAYNMGIDATIEVTRLANSLDPYYRQNIYELGGIQQAVQKAIQGVSGFMSGTQTGQNFALGINNFGSQFLGQDPVSQMNSIAALMAKGPQAYFQAKGKGAGAFSGTDFQTQAMGITSYIYELMKLAGLTDSEGNADEFTFLGFGTNFLQGQGLNTSVEELKQMLNISRTSKLNSQNMEGRILYTKVLSDIRSQEYTIGDYFNYMLKEMISGTGAYVVGDALEGAYYNFGKFVSSGTKSLMDGITGTYRIDANDFRDVDSNLIKGYVKDMDLINNLKYGETIQEESDVYFWADKYLQTYGADNEAADELTKEFRKTFFDQIKNGTIKLPDDKNTSARNIHIAIKERVGKNYPETSTKNKAILNLLTDPKAQQILIKMGYGRSLEGQQEGLQLATKKEENTAFTGTDDQIESFTIQLNWNGLNPEEYDINKVIETFKTTSNLNNTIYELRGESFYSVMNPYSSTQDAAKEVLRKYKKRDVTKTSIDDLVVSNFDLLGYRDYVNDDKKYGKGKEYMRYNFIYDELKDLDFSKTKNANDILNLIASNVNIDGKGTHVDNWQLLPEELLITAVAAGIINNPNIPEDKRSMFQKEYNQVIHTKRVFEENNELELEPEAPIGKHLKTLISDNISKSVSKTLQDKINSDPFLVSKTKQHINPNGKSLPSLDLNNTIDYLQRPEANKHELEQAEILKEYRSSLSAYTLLTDMDGNNISMLRAIDLSGEELIGEKTRSYPVYKKFSNILDSMPGSTLEIRTEAKKQIEQDILFNLGNGLDYTAQFSHEVIRANRKKGESDEDVAKRLIFEDVTKHTLAATIDKIKRFEDNPTMSGLQFTPGIDNVYKSNIGDSENLKVLANCVSDGAIKVKMVEK